MTNTSAPASLLQRIFGNAESRQIGFAYASYYGMLGIMQPYLAALLSERGYAAQSVGALAATVAFVSGTMPIIVNRLAARWQIGRGRLFRCTAAVAWLLSVALAASSQHAPAWLYVALLLLLCGAYAPITTLIDGMALEASAKGRVRFGGVRMLGSLGFIAASAAIGAAAQRAQGQYAQSFHFGISAMLLLVCFCAWGQSDQTAATSKSKGNKQLPWPLAVFLCACALHHCAFGPYQYGYTLLAKAVGISPANIGLSWSIAVGSEVLGFAAAPWLLRRMRWQSLVAVGISASLVRWLLLGLAPTPLRLMLSQCLHGPGFALFTAGAVAGLATWSKRCDISLAQTLFSSVVAGLTPGLGMLLAGWVHAHQPLRAVFLCGLPLEIAALCLLLMSVGGGKLQARRTAA